MKTDEEISKELFDYIVLTLAEERNIQLTGPYAFLRRGEIEAEASRVVAMFMVEHSLRRFLSGGAKFSTNMEKQREFFNFYFNEAPDLDLEYVLGERTISIIYETQYDVVDIKEIQQKDERLKAISETSQQDLSLMIDTISQH